MVNHYSTQFNIKIKEVKDGVVCVPVFSLYLSHMTCGSQQQTVSYSNDKNNNLHASFLVFLVKATKISISFSCTITGMEYNKILSGVKCT